jgi:hypothetical protein
MLTAYALWKFGHVLIAILALGTSAGLSIVLEFYGDNPAHAAFVLGIVNAIVIRFVLPGYMLMFATGLWLMHLAWSPTTSWVRDAMALWGVGFVLLGTFLIALRKQRALVNQGSIASAPCRRVALFGRAVGGSLGLVVVSIVYLMVVKPSG